MDLDAIPLQALASRIPTGKRTRRRLMINCKICGTHFECPKDRDFWHWMKCGDVLDFYKMHLQHGSTGTVGAEIDYVEEVVES